MKQQISQMMFDRYKNYQYQYPTYNPSANFDWIRTQSGLPWLPLTLSVPYTQILSEINNIEPLLSLHREEYNEHKGWKSFCIHGKSFDSTREDAHYNNVCNHDWTPEAEKLMPVTVEYFKTRWPANQFSRLRVMLLEPQGYISIHKDNNIAELAPINIAITQPEGCNFVIEKKGTVPFVPGQAIWMDVSGNHTVFNNSNQRRWHIIVHQSFDNIDFQNEVVKSYHILYNCYNENRDNHNS